MLNDVNVVEDGEVDGEARVGHERELVEATLDGDNAHVGV